MTVDSDDDRVTADKTDKEDKDEFLLGHTVLLDDNEENPHK